MRYKEIKSNPNLSQKDIASILLKRSCESARDRCNRAEGKYKDICCNLTPIKLKDALMNEKAFWIEWVKLTEEWVERGYKDRDRPSLDRIDEKGHYEIGNIQALPHWKNTAKGKSKKCIIVNYYGNLQLECEMIWGLDKTLKKLGLSRKEITEEHKNQLSKADYLFFTIQSDTSR
jgi:hypothetical protein